MLDDYLFEGMSTWYKDFIALLGEEVAIKIMEKYRKRCSACEDFHDCIEYPKCEALIYAAPKRVGDNMGWSVAMDIRRFEEGTTRFDVLAKEVNEKMGEEEMTCVNCAQCIEEPTCRSDHDLVCAVGRPDYVHGGYLHIRCADKHMKKDCPDFMWKVAE